MQQFVSSMPERYSQAFDVLDIQQHAAIARDRGSKVATVGQFASFRHRGAALCIVAADRPGLLAAISASLTLVGLDVIEAEIFTRRVSANVNEAVDLFWVSRTAPPKHHPLTVLDLQSLDRCLAELLGKSELELPPPATSPFCRAPESATRIHFREDSEGRFTTLEVEANDRSGLLLAVSQALFAARVQIIGSRLKMRDGNAIGRFDLVELNEARIVSSRRNEIQLAVLTAIDNLLGACAPAVAV
jgi:[protein-PII] uridylyltransferase